MGLMSSASNWNPTNLPNHSPRHERNLVLMRFQTRRAASNRGRTCRRRRHRHLCRRRPSESLPACSMCRNTSQLAARHCSGIERHFSGAAASHRRLDLPRPLLPLQVRVFGHGRDRHPSCWPATTRSTARPPARELFEVLWSTPGPRLATASRASPWRRR